jgi:ABC-2 type transport system ATP-binding protein
MKHVIETSSLTKVFRDWWGRSKVIAVDELNLTVSENEVFGLLGPNGSGKTTTLKMLLGLLYPTKGKVSILGGQSTDPKISAKIGYLPEESYLYRHLSARETLDFYGRLFSLPSRVREMRTESLLEMVGLGAVAGRPVGTFSKGMARRIGLAQALINDPQVLILDEPTSGLDPLGTRQIKDLIIQLKERGKTILLCSHLLADVEDVCDRISVLYGGKVQTEGRVGDLLLQQDKKQITAASINEDTLNSIKSILDRDGLDYEIAVPQDKLESFFIRTIEDARTAGRKTSGAQSDASVQISSFLTGDSENKNVLDDLVKARPDKAEMEPQSEISRPQPAEPDNGSFKKDILEQLTRSGTKAVPVDTPPEKAPEPEHKKEINKDILESLTRPKKGDDSEGGTDNG